MSGRTRKETVELEYIAKIEGLKNELAKLPGISDAEAKKMVKGLDRELKSATKIAKKAAKAQADAAKKASSKWGSFPEVAEGVKRSLEGVGGAAGSSAGQVEHFARSGIALTQALGPVGAAIVAATLATTGFVAAGVAAAFQADALQTEMEELGRIPIITLEQQQSLRNVTTATSELEIAAKEAAIAFGAEFGPAVASVLHELAGLIEHTGQGIRLFKEWAPLMGKLGGDLDTLGTIFGQNAEEIEEHARATRKAQEAQKEFDDYLKAQERNIADRNAADQREAEAAAAKKLRDAEAELRKQQREAAAASRKAAAERQRERQAAIQATERLEAITKQQQDSQLTGEDKIVRAHERRLEQIELLEQKGGDSHAAQLARYQSEQAAITAMEELRRQERAKSAEQAARISEERQRRLEKEQEQARKLAEDEAEKMEELRQREMESIEDAVLATFDAITMVVEDSFRRQEEAARDAAQDYMRQLETMRDRRFAIDEELANATDAATKAELKQEKRVLDAKIAMTKRSADTEKEEMRKAFNRRKALNIIQVLIDSAAATMRGFAELGPPPTPGGWAVAATMTAITAAQVGMIASQKPPQLHDGGMVAAALSMPAQLSQGPDELDIRARSGERVVSQSTAEQHSGLLDFLERGQGHNMNPNVTVLVSGKDVASEVLSGMEDRMEGRHSGYAPVYQE